MSFWKSKDTKARKEHFCEFCGKTIHKNEMYSKETGVYEGEFNDYCLCERCRQFISYFRKFDNYELGGLVDDLDGMDLLRCSSCGSVNRRNTTYTENCSYAEFECRDCGNKNKIDLSIDNLISISCLNQP